MDLALRTAARHPTPRPRVTVLRGRALQQRLGRWALRSAVAFAVLAGLHMAVSAVGWSSAVAAFARLEWIGGLLVLVTMACATGWGLAESHYGAPARPVALARLCRLRSQSHEVDDYLREVAAQGRSLTNDEAYELLRYYGPLHPAAGTARAQ